MVDHMRHQIRDAAVAALQAGVTAVSNRVYAGRVAPLKQDELPALIVMTFGEESAEGPVVGGNQTVVRTLQLIVDITDTGNASLIDDLDALADAVEETLMAAPGTLGGKLMVPLRPPSSDWSMDDNGEMAERTGVLRMSFPATYRTVLADPTTQA